MSAEQSLFLNCKLGNLNEVQRVVEIKYVNLNVRDRWDSTPLYYACLCGHKEVVEYLLQNGAKCEASTFDGERCLYGALTNDIRNILLNWKQIHSTGKRRDRHYELLRQLYEDDKTSKDITFNISDVAFGAHRCLLVARSSFFADALNSKWLNKSMVAIRQERVFPESFQALLQFLYLGRLDVGVDFVGELKKLAEFCKLSHLMEEITRSEEKLAKLVSLKPSMRSKVKILTVESDFSMAQLSTDLRELAELTLPPELRQWTDGDILPFYDFNNNLNCFPDVCIEVESHRFLCHKVFFVGQSDYFKALIDDHFHEINSESDVLPVIKLRHISAETFRHVVIYVYSGKTEFQCLDDALEVLAVADMMLLPGLKRSCGNIIAQCLDDENVVEMYRCSQTFNLPILEDHCTGYMARELDTLLDNEEFVELVLEEAYSVKDRQETDSIPIVDDIRYRITSAAGTYSDIEEANAKLSRLDVTLARLGIEC